MTPITIQISLAMGINPLALLMPEVMASNVVGISTLVGTPDQHPDRLLCQHFVQRFSGQSDAGCAAGPGGLDHLQPVHLPPRTQAAGSARQCRPCSWKSWRERGRITEPDHLKKAGWVGAGMILLFVFGEQIHLLPAVTALMGATALLVWIRPDIEEMIEAVDWTTLVFFICPVHRGRRHPGGGLDQPDR